MAEEFEVVELEYSEDDILYYLVDEDDNEVGFVIEQDGVEVECYYEGYESDSFEVVDEADGDSAAEEVEIEISEDDILYYLLDENDVEIGFVIEEDGHEVECYYAEDDDEQDDGVYEPEKAEDHGYLHKIASIAGHEGDKARKKAEVQLDKVRGKAEVQADKALKTAAAQKDKAKAKADELDLGITREGVAEATSDLNAIAKEGAETAKELKEAYDDIMENFGFLMPKKVRRRLP